MAPSITYVDDNKLIEAIHNARYRLVFLAPGVNQGIAAELTDAWKRLNTEAVTVILDVDPEVCRLGYGTFEGLKTLREAASNLGALVCHQPGVRIGLLVSDDTTIVYSPTPLLIEAGSKQPDQPNAIVLDALPKQVACDIGLGDNPNLERVIGLDPVRPHQIDELAQDLSVAPPVKFNLARQVHVFTSRFQFVELEMTGCYISLKKVPIPSNLLGLSNKKDIESQVHAHFSLINSGRMEVRYGDKVFTEEGLRKKKQQIVRDYLISLTGYGSVVLRAHQEKLKTAVDELCEDVFVFSEGIKNILQAHMDNNAEALVNALLPAVKHNPPKEYTKIYGLNIPEKQLKSFLIEDVRAAFGKSEDLIQDMKVKLVFKDVTYESLIDKKFLDVARAAMPGVTFLHEEYDAAKAENKP
jgi:hypothetical protein